jgi:CDP-diacylglycerol--serine O-phosphatidyltransferase
MARRRVIFRSAFFKHHPLSRIAPNLATLASLCIGLSQIRFALQGRWELAVLAVVFAALLDATDGRLARKLGSCSRFGAELDSLSDFAVFGLGPAIVMYLFSLNAIGRYGWFFSVFFSACTCLRLARFNTHDIENIKSPIAAAFFIGVPAPAGAVLGLAPLIFYNGFGLEASKNPALCALVFLAAGCLMISKIPTFSLKKFHIKRKYYLKFLIGVVLFCGLVYMFTWKAFFAFALIYAGSIFFSYLQGKKLCPHQE